MPFESILFHRPEERPGVEVPEAPDFFPDLNLDQVVRSLTAGRAEYQLEPFFHAPPRDLATVHYRQEVMRDLERPEVSEPVRAFARDMRRMRECLAHVRDLYYQGQKERWFLDAVGTYCGAVRSLAEGLAGLDIGSRGLVELRRYLAGYIGSSAFQELAAETRELQLELARLRYCVHIKGNRVRVSPYMGEADYSADIERTFERFRQGEVKDYRVAFPDALHMDHVEARILDLVARLYPDVFARLHSYVASRRHYLDEKVAGFDREVQFYLAYLDYVRPFKAAGLPFCYPEVSRDSKSIRARGAFDLALAQKLAAEGSSVVCNDFHLNDPERVLVITGPNQGGKTTFARMFGQLHYLASLGYPVPAAEARLFLPDRIFTHFQREESVGTFRGTLEDDLFRLREILREATAESIIVMNESFSSTTVRDAIVIGQAVIREIIERDALCVCVTFVDELASLSERTVSMMSTVDPSNPERRTYRIVRRPADGLAYAMVIAARHGLTYEQLLERIRP